MTFPICAAPGAIVMYSLGRELYESEDMAFDLRDPQGCEGVGMPNGLSKLSERSTKCCIDFFRTPSTSAKYSML